MAQHQTTIKAASVELACGARAASIAVGAALLWRAIGAPRLGPVLLGLSGIAVIWQGLSHGSPEPEATAASTRPRIRGPRRAAADDAVDRTSEDSFPASDPPSWTPTNGTQRRH